MALAHPSDFLFQETKRLLLRAPWLPPAVPLPCPILVPSGTPAHSTPGLSCGGSNAEGHAEGRGLAAELASTQLGLLLHRTESCGKSVPLMALAAGQPRRSPSPRPSPRLCHGSSRVPRLSSRVGTAFEISY